VLARTELDAKRSQTLFGAELRATKQELDAASPPATWPAPTWPPARPAPAPPSKPWPPPRAPASPPTRRRAPQAQLKDAQNQLGYVECAPADGRIGKRTVEVGQRVQPGQQLAAIVEPEVWIVANFKETQLERMKPGQKVHVKLDAFPGQELRPRSTASRRPRAPASRCCRRTTPPATSPRSCSACRSSWCSRPRA
jgi:membrane fusion protein (multidrug efflux system)